MKNLQPKETWTWLQAHPDTLLVDVRMETESLYVGRPPGMVHGPWYEYPDLQPDPQKFAGAVAREASGKAQPVLLICRSGRRTLVQCCMLDGTNKSDGFGVRARRKPQRYPQVSRGVATPPWRKRRGFMFQIACNTALDAGKALEAAGFSDVRRVVHGFEGELDAQFRRSTLSGWRFDGRPWEQM